MRPVISGRKVRIIRDDVNHGEREAWKPERFGLVDDRSSRLQKIGINRRDLLGLAHF